MKKVALAIAFASVLTACGGSNTNTGSTPVDTTKKVVDTTKVDSIKVGGGKLNQPLK